MFLAFFSLKNVLFFLVISFSFYLCHVLLTKYYLLKLWITKNFSMTLELANSN